VRGADSVVLDDDDDSVDDPSRIRLMLRTNDNRKCSLIIGKVGTCSSFVARGCIRYINCFWKRLLWSIKSAAFYFV